MQLTEMRRKTIAKQWARSECILYYIDIYKQREYRVRPELLLLCAKQWEAYELWWGSALGLSSGLAFA